MHWPTNYKCFRYHKWCKPSIPYSSEAGPWMRVLSTWRRCGNIKLSTFQWIQRKQYFQPVCTLCAMCRMAPTLCVRCASVCTCLPCSAYCLPCLCVCMRVASTEHSTSPRLVVRVHKNWMLPCGSPLTYTQIRNTNTETLTPTPPPRPSHMTEYIISDPEHIVYMTQDTVHHPPDMGYGIVSLLRPHFHLAEKWTHAKQKKHWKFVELPCNVAMWASTKVRKRSKLCGFHYLKPLFGFWFLFCHFCNTSFLI